MVKLQDTKLIHRNLLHFYTLTTKNREIKETVPFTISLKRIKYLGLNLPKEGKDLYSKNCKTLMRERNWRQHKQMERCTMFLDWWINISKVTILPKATYRFNAISITNGIFHRTRIIFLICIETQKTQSSQKNLEKEEQSWRNHMPWLHTILQSYSNQNIWY